MDGQILDAEAKEKVKRCLEAAIERRCSEVRIERIILLLWTCGTCGRSRIVYMLLVQDSPITLNPGFGVGTCILVFEVLSEISNWHLLVLAGLTIGSVHKRPSRASD